MKQCETSPFNHPGLQWLAYEAGRAGLDLYLVGGCVRDYLRGKHCADYDLVSAQDPTPVAKLLARTFNGHWFWLDPQRRYSRVVLPSSVQFDFSPFRAPDLYADLSLRDFTINAMAVSLQGLGASAANQSVSVQIIDPLNGQRDLHQEQIHLCSATVLDDDPLRLLKGLRHCATMGFTLSSATRQAAPAAAAQLHCIAPERIRAEIAGIFSAPALEHLYYALKNFNACRAHRALQLPTSSQAYLDTHLLPALEQAIARVDLCATSCPYIHERLYWSAGDEFTFRSLGLLGIWLRVILHHSETSFVADNTLKLSRKAATWLNWFLRCPEDIFLKLEQIEWRRYPRRALHLLSRNGAPLPHGLTALVFLASDMHAVAGLADLFQVCGTQVDQGRIKPLIEAAQIQNRYSRMHGKALGECIKSLQHAEYRGEFSDTAGAWKWMEEYQKG
ncbi:MAG: hypothetical protein ACOC0G_02645 [Thermodesulfobacteriota bacterium]